MSCENKTLSEILSNPVNDADYQLPPLSLLNNPMLFGILSHGEYPDAIKTVVPVGYHENGEPVSANIGKLSNVLVAGNDGTGKTSLLRVFMLSMLFRAKPSDVRFLVITPHADEFSAFAGIPHLLCPVIDDKELALHRLSQITDEMNARFDRLGDAGTRSVDDYNRLVEEKPEVGAKIPKIVILIDELAFLQSEDDSRFADIFMKYAAKSKAAGIYTVLTTSTYAPNVLSGIVRCNISTTLAFKLPDSTDEPYFSVLPEAETLTNPHDLVVSFGCNTTPERVVPTLALPKEIERVCDFIRDQKVGQ